MNTIIQNKVDINFMKTGKKYNRGIYTQLVCHVVILPHNKINNL